MTERGEKISKELLLGLWLNKLGCTLPLDHTYLATLKNKCFASLGCFAPGEHVAHRVMCVIIWYYRRSALSLIYVPFTTLQNPKSGWHYTLASIWCCYIYLIQAQTWIMSNVLHQQDSKICQFYPSDTRKSRYFCPKYWKGRVFSVNCQILCNSASLNSTYYTERVTFCINSWNFYLSYSSLLWIDADIRLQ